MSACVIGLGRVGLPTAALIAASGQPVLGVDSDPTVLAAIASGEAGAGEPGLAALLREVRAAGRLSLAAQPAPAQISVIAVPTPLDPAENRPDLTALDAAVAALGEIAPADGLVVVTSTVPVGTTDRLGAALRAVHPARAVACCPERLWPGDALREMRDNPRIVGGVDPESTERAATWLASWVRGPIDRTTARTAELAKLMENAARDVAIALAQTVADTARALGVDPDELRTLVERHPRVSLLDAGIGVGGHCLPVDPWFAIGAAPAETALLRAAREVNDATPERWAARIAERARERGASRIGLLGLAYKPGSDDVRNAPAVRIARRLAERFEVRAADPRVRAVEDLDVVPIEEALRAEVVVLLVAHPELVALRDRVPERALRIDACGGWR